MAASSHPETSEEPALEGSQHCVQKNTEMGRYETMLRPRVDLPEVNPNLVLLSSIQWKMP